MLKCVIIPACGSSRDGVSSWDIVNLALSIIHLGIPPSCLVTLNGLIRLLHALHVLHWLCADPYPWLTLEFKGNIFLVQLSLRLNLIPAHIVCICILFLRCILGIVILSIHSSSSISYSSCSCSYNLTSSPNIFVLAKSIAILCHGSLCHWLWVII